MSLEDVISPADLAELNGQPREEYGGYGVHPVAALFPLVSRDELQGLADDIKKNGLREAIRLVQMDDADPDSEWVIMDGRNRFRACELAGVDPRFVQAATAPEEIGPWIISHNLHRRHLTASQRAAIAVEYERVEAAAAKKRSGVRTDLGVNLPPGSEGKARDKAAEVFNVSGKSVSDAKFLAEHDPEAFERVRNGEQAVSAAAKDARAKNSPPKPEPTIEERAKKAAERIYREGNDYAREVMNQLTKLTGGIYE